MSRERWPVHLAVHLRAEEVGRLADLGHHVQGHDAVVVHAHALHDLGHRRVVGLVDGDEAGL
eukprot:9392466-Heterocapsa_arctica.AAC.1